MPDIKAERPEIHAWLTAQGWKPWEDGFIDRHDDKYVVLNDDDWGWVLNVFTDGDIDGVAVGRWKNFAEGDTLAELQEAFNAR